MDTNSIAVLRDLLETRPRDGGTQALLIATMVLSFLGPLLNAIVNRINANALAIKIEDAKNAAAATTATVDKIHVEVNNKTTVMVAKIDELQAKVLELTQSKAASAENQRVTEIRAEQGMSEAQVQRVIAAINAGHRVGDAQLDRPIKES